MAKIDTFIISYSFAVESFAGHSLSHRSYLSPHLDGGSHRIFLQRSCYRRSLLWHSTRLPQLNISYGIYLGCLCFSQICSKHTIKKPCCMPSAYGWRRWDIGLGGPMPWSSEVTVSIFLCGLLVCFGFCAMDIYCCRWRVLSMLASLSEMKEHRNQRIDETDPHGRRHRTQRGKGGASSIYAYIYLHKCVFASLHCVNDQPDLLRCPGIVVSLPISL